MKKSLWAIVAIIAIVLIDQITKIWILNKFMHILNYAVQPGAPFIANKWDIIPHPMMPSVDATYYITDFFNIVFTWNPGTAFSFLQKFGEARPLVITLATGVIIALISYYLFARAKNYERWPLILIIGGALGNLIDRIRFGAVIDFLYFHVGGWNWPAFNVADSFITVGVLLYILNWWLARRRCMRNLKG